MKSCLNILNGQASTRGMAKEKAEARKECSILPPSDLSAAKLNSGIV